MVDPFTKKRSIQRLLKNDFSVPEPEKEMLLSSAGNSQMFCWISSLVTSVILLYPTNIIIFYFLLSLRKISIFFARHICCNYEHFPTVGLIKLLFSILFNFIPLKISFLVAAAVGVINA